MKGVIIKNAAECKVCHEVIESTHVHDFVSCRGDHIAVDGGKAYLRRMFDNPENIIERSEVEYHPVSRWLTQRLAAALIRHEDQPLQITIQKTLENALRYEASYDIRHALQELPFWKVITYDDIKQIDDVIRKELIGE